MRVMSVQLPGLPLSGSVDLPASKSVSNRALIIQALCSTPFEIANLSVADDTRLLKQCIDHPAAIEDAGAGGTTFRFLLALRTLQQHQGVLSGSPRLMERPVRVLVDLLRSMGASIDYAGTDGFPPLKLRGGALSGGVHRVDASVSSQFVSALMLIGPRLPGGLTIVPTGEMVSATYIAMTASMMRYFGVPVLVTADQIVIPEMDYTSRDISVSSDWSAAAFFFALAALCPHSELLLKGLHFDHWQGDESAAELMLDWGVSTVVQGDGLLLRSSGIPHREFVYDFLATPDLAQAFAVMAAVAGRKLTLTGLQTLRQKETDRLSALKESLEMAGAEVIIGNDYLQVVSGVSAEKISSVNFEAYHDHRMVMALSLLACSGAVVRLKDPGQVSKSFPGFFKALAATGAQIEELSF